VYVATDFPPLLLVYIELPRNTARDHITSNMHFTTTFALATASISSVAAMAIKRPWIHDDARSYRHFTPIVTKKAPHLSIRGTELTKPAEKKKNSLDPPAVYISTNKVHDHDKYLPGSTPHSQKEIDAAAAHADAPLDIVAKQVLDYIPTGAKESLQLFYRGADSAEAVEEKKHHLHSHEDYPSELGRTYRLHGHAEYLDGSGPEATEALESISDDVKDIPEKKVQRRCMWEGNCQDICEKGGVAGWIGCTWAYWDDANTPMCPESRHVGSVG
jgi:hypothetical protein